MASPIFHLSGSIVVLPVLHGSGDFALEVQERVRAGPYDCLAVPLPPAFEEGVDEAVGRLPGVHIVAQPEGGMTSDPTSYTSVPIDPCQPVITGIRCALDRGIPRSYIDLEVGCFVEQAMVHPDPYAIKEVPLEKFAAAVLTGLPRPEDGSQQIERIHWMAFQLHRLELDFDRILFLCDIADWPWIRDAYRRRLQFPNPSPPPLPPEIYRAAPENLYFVLGELPFITSLYEHRRAEMLPARTLAVDGVKALLLEARSAWLKKHDLKTHWLTPQALSLMLQYIRNLTLLDRRLTPDLYTLALAAKQVAGDDFAVTVIETARDYPPQRVPTIYPEVHLGIGTAAFPSGEAVVKDRLKGVATDWRTLPLRPTPPPEKKTQWRMQWDPNQQCSYPPEDEKIESFNAHVREQARQIIGQDLARSEKFTASLKDGLDIRETLRNWHTGDIYVKEMPPARGSVEVVVFLFESPADPEKFPWRTTWYAEHNEESTLCFFATNFAENIVGPGIGEAIYGGGFLLYPPRPIMDVWRDPRFDHARTPEERLLSGALCHSRDKRVVLVSPHPPTATWRRIARRYKKQLVTIPLRRFSLQTLDRLRHFHVLNGRLVRSYAAKFIRDFR